MGNCLFGGMGDGNEVIKVTTSNGGIMEFHPPINVESITDEFPGHGIFRSHDLFWKPLPHNEELLPGESYYLLPLDDESIIAGPVPSCSGHVRSKSVPHVPSHASAPYRMSFDSQGIFKKRSHAEAFPRCGNGRFWKVKLVISTDQLLEILAQEGKTEELIESVRTVAKCNAVSAITFSDQWSRSSSRNASSKKDVLLEF